MADREAVIAHWRRMSDEQFTYFATHEAADIKPEAVGILRQELRRRGTVPDPDAAIDVQLRQLSSVEFESMITRFRLEPCPLCRGSGGLLNGIALNRAGTSELVVGCTQCLEKQIKSVNKASVAMLLVRPLRGLGALEQNVDARVALESGAQTQALREYVWRNRGEWVHLLK